MTSGKAIHELVRTELMRESLIAVVDEMRANVIHSSCSSIIYEGQRFRGSGPSGRSADLKAAAAHLKDEATGLLLGDGDTPECLAKLANGICRQKIATVPDPAEASSRRARECAM